MKSVVVFLALVALGHSNEQALAKEAFATLQRMAKSCESRDMAQLETVTTETLYKKMSKYISFSKGAISLTIKDMSLISSKPVVVKADFTFKIDGQTHQRGEHKFYMERDPKGILRVAKGETEESENQQAARKASLDLVQLIRAGKWQDVATFLGLKCRTREDLHRELVRGEAAGIHDALEKRAGLRSARIKKAQDRHYACEFDLLKKGKYVSFFRLSFSDLRTPSKGYRLTLKGHEKQELVPVIRTELHAIEHATCIVAMHLKDNGRYLKVASIEAIHGQARKPPQQQ